MTSNPTGKNTSISNDPFLIKEDEKVFEILNPPGKTLTKFDEIAGMIAYAQYSLQKHQFVSKYQQEEGKPPTEDLLKSIVMSFKDENSAALLSLKQKSEILLREYAREYLENAKREEIIEPIQKIIEKRTSFWSSIWANIAAAVLYSFVVAVILFTATVALPNTKFSRIIRILMEESSNSTYPGTNEENK
jgi:hypothetical protein